MPPIICTSIKKLSKAAEDINALEPELQALSDEALSTKTQELKQKFEKHTFLSQTDLTRTGIISNSFNEMFEAQIVSFYVSTAIYLFHSNF
jgi:preprotein translocase subunit SecA